MTFTVTAPLRVDIGGGITDIPLFASEVGTKLFTIGVDFYGDHKYKDKKNVSIRFTTTTPNKPLAITYNDSEITFDFAAEEEMSFIRQGMLGYLKKIPLTGYELAISDNFPGGIGLGGSTALLMSMFAGLDHIEKKSTTLADAASLMNRTYTFETVNLDILKGFQDYIVSYYGKANYIDFPTLNKKNIEDSATLGMLLSKEATEYIDNHLIILVLKNTTISSGIIVEDEITNYLMEKDVYTPYLEVIRDSNEDLFKLFTKPHFSVNDSIAVGEVINTSWGMQKKLSSFIQNQIFQDIEDKITPLVYGLRGLGAGGNSRCLFVKHKKMDEVRAILSEYEDQVEIYFAKLNTTGLQIS